VRVLPSGPRPGHILTVTLLLATIATTAAEPAGGPVEIVAEAACTNPPAWAALERELFAAMDRSGEGVLARYTRPDGSLLWPPSPEFQSVDALDDAHESFHNWPLYYCLGGDTRFLAWARREFEAITLQFTRHGTGKGYPMVVKEYQPAYDWFHQGEGNLLFYMLCMADPGDARMIERARRFAGFYLNEDLEAPNYDPVRRLIRCAHCGSRGPAFWNFDGSPIWTASGYGLPFYDVPGCATVEDLQNPDTARRMGEVATARRGRGDSAVNLAATTLALNAFLLTGDAKYRDWVRGYVDAWMARARANGGLVPDNVGLSGRIGEHMDGKWYGANYGWTWPHGWESVGQAATIAAQNAAVLRRDPRYLDLPRRAMDRLTAEAIVTNGVRHVPHKYGDPGRVRYTPWPWMPVLRNPDKTALERNGWFEFMPMHPMFPAHLWTLSGDPADLERAAALAGHSQHPWTAVSGWPAKDQGGNEGAWLAYLSGAFTNYPEAILRHNLKQVEKRLAFVRDDREPPERYGDSYFQQRNPITCEGLVQLTLGGPLPMYNGGALMTLLRHFDCDARRPGLPPDVAALVSSIKRDRVVLDLANLSATEPRRVLVQAGGLGEHRFTRVRWGAPDGPPAGSRRLRDRHLLVRLPPQTRVRLELGLRRFAQDPTYRLPWTEAGKETSAGHAPGSGRASAAGLSAPQVAAGAYLSLPHPAGAGSGAAP
jgi:hypothetical protein